MSAGPQAPPPVIGWRGFHSELRRAAMAATRTGRPLALLILELAGLPAIRQGHGAAVAGGLVRALVGLLEAELGAGGRARALYRGPARHHPAGNRAR